MSSSSNNVSLVWNGNMFLLSINSTPPQYLYSYDGKTWNTISMVNPSHPNKVKWTGSQFSVAGNVVTQRGNTLLKSGNGVQFTPLFQKTDIPPLKDIEADLEFPHTISFPRNMMLALGGSLNDTVKIAFSTDNGMSWTPSANSSSVFTTTAYNARWNGKTWIAVGQGKNTLATSKDGNQWLGRGSYIFSTAGHCIEWNPEQSLWVAGGKGTNTLAFSYDGVYWTAIENPFFSETKDIVWNGTLWVATGVPVSTVSIIYSYDGRTWYSIANQTNPIDIQGTQLSWNGSFWTAIGESSTQHPIATSHDGIHWDFFVYNTNLNHIYTTDSQTFLIDASSNVVCIPDSQFSNGFPVSVPVDTPTAISYNQTYFLAGGGNQVATSPDGIHWSSSSTLENMSSIQRMVWNHPEIGTPQIQPLTIAVGEGNNTIGYSKDGIYWKGLGNQTFFTRGNKAVWNGSLWVAVGEGGFWVATSYDGIHWLGRDSSLMEKGLDVAWNGTVFVAVGSGGSHKFATSEDGIYWKGVEEAENIFSLRASAISWTGKVWLAYGSGGNTTAFSPSLDGGSNWNPTVAKNQVITDASSLFVGSLFPPVVTSSSSSQPDSSKIFDITQTGGWSSQTGTYDSVTGKSTNNTTLYNLVETASGEWIQIAVDTPQTIVYYYLAFNEAPPCEWILLGSNNGTDWSLIEEVDNIEPTTRIQIRNLYSVDPDAYTYYRWVFPSIFSGTQVAVSKIELFYENSQTTILDPTIRPIVTKTNVLYPLSFFSPWNQTRGTYYQVADLYGNVISDAQINGMYTADLMIDVSGNSHLTSSCFDGENQIVTGLSGEIYHLSNEHLNTNLVFSKGVIASNMDHILTSCFNGQRMVLGGKEIAYSSLVNGETDFHTSLNGSSLFTQINGLASNSGYGFINIPNKIYLNPKDKLSVVGPRTYNTHLSHKNTISISLHNVTPEFKNTTDTLSVPFSLFLEGMRGPTGSTGATGQMGSTGLMGMGMIGQTGPTGQIGPTGPVGDGLWLENNRDITTGNVIIGGGSLMGTEVLKVTGNVNVSGNMTLGNVSINESLFSNAMEIGKVGGGNVGLDVSGNMLIQNQLTIGSGSPSNEYALDVQGIVNVNTIMSSSMTKRIGYPWIMDSSNILIDYHVGDEYYMDVGISITDLYNCVVNNLPIDILPNAVYHITILNDYRQSTMDRYYCDQMTVNGISYDLYFTNGTPQRLSTQFKQTFKIFCIDSNIQIIYSTITNYSI